MQQDWVTAEPSRRRMFDFDFLSRMWESDRKFLLWQRKAWHE
jgi:hypothetical protein